MRPALSLKLNQQLSITPQLKQAIKLLQLSSLELQTEVQQALEENPMLERIDERFESVAEGIGQPDLNGKANDTVADDGGADLDYERLDAEDVPWQAEAGPVYQGATGQQRSYDTPLPQREAADTDGDSLAEHLLWQLHLSDLAADDRPVAAAIVDAIDDDGFLRSDLAELQRVLGGPQQVAYERIHRVLERVQLLDPIGVGARDLGECLKLQLLADGRLDEAGLSIALTIAEDYLVELAKGDCSAIASALRTDPDDVAVAMAAIKRMDPKPGARITAAQPEYVMPDVYVRKRNGCWRAIINDAVAPRLAVSELYTRLVKSANASDASYMRGQLQEARWLIKSLAARNDTLMKVANSIVEQQQDFFEHGPTHMRALVLRDVADEINMHESTVSRMTTRKYLNCPRGVFELKYFFSSHVGTHDGGEASAIAIQARIKCLIEDEPVGKPLSDAKLASLLQQEGVDIARRTVAKYREAQNIGSSTQRRKMM